MRELGIVDHGSVKVKLYLRLLLGGGFDALMDLDPFALAFALVRRGFPRGPRSFELGLKLTERRAVELSKIYVLPDAHGGTVSAALMGAAVDDARRRGAAVLWLGVNQKNQRAQRFYAKQGLSVAGTKTFTVGAAVENDYVMVRPL